MIAIYGATGFTGRQAAAYVAKHGAMPFVLVGRSREKLHAVAAGLPRSAEIRVADSSDPPSVASALDGARVVVNTAGPYVRYGDPVVAAAVAQGIDYVDITGETPWVRSLIDRFDERAREKGVRIVPMCGFDSVPSDLGAFLVARFLGETSEIYAGFSMKGGLNGG
ncbi:MAG: saccharopine dehydrogenase NADP-binding domain-containing protein, partial [Deltaproteobacteria bacterium]|nr:saccharopine dehydrogenase NADP-binding domain-containing protein [Deltaproteobacteria bacterium]